MESMDHDLQVMISEVRSRKRVQFTFEDLQVNTKDRRDQQLPMQSVQGEEVQVEQSYKVFFGIMFFVTTYWDPRKIKNPTVICVSRYPNQDLLSALSKLIPEIQWIVSTLEQLDREPLVDLDPKSTLFYCDERPKDEEDNIRIMDLQYKLYLRISPAAGAMRVKFPTTDSFYTYASGTLFYLPLDSSPTQEFLLVSTSKNKMKYAVYRVYSQSSYFNQVVRNYKRYEANWQSDDVTLGSAIEWDRAAQGFIVSRYLQKYSKDAELSSADNVAKVLEYISSIVP